jgi:hypothetical protein
MRLPKPALILCLGSACLCHAARAQERRSVRDVTGFVRSAIQLKQPDGDVAKALRKLALTESLDDRTIFQLQSEGAGPKTVAELRRLMEAARALPKPAAPVASAKPVPPPSFPDQKVLVRVSDEAINFDQQERQVLQDLAERSALALKAALLQKDLDRDSTNLKEIQKIGFAFSAALEIERLRESVLKGALKASKLDAGTFREIDATGTRWILKVALHGEEHIERYPVLVC